ncbi:unnamed protein product [Polarella glacialis]|uniref:J domain-containing protein n=1 Tax=Polarella glacialis TaxID=89957 RepID=A0A813K486_POLGL|nr:unnamed protein product [Polarella glacialis]
MPLALFLEAPKKRRLVGKQSPAVCLQQPVSDPSADDESYAPACKMLGVALGASADQVRNAYLKKALVFHPDKETGSVQKFQQLLQALDLVAGRTLDRRGSATNDMKCSEEVFWWRLLELPSETWPERLKAVPRGYLESLLRWLAERKDGLSDPDRHVYKDVWGTSTAKTGLFEKNGEYWVQLQWSLLICMMPMTKSLEQALRWHCDVCLLRMQAQREMKVSRLPFEEAVKVFNCNIVLKFQSNLLLKVRVVRTPFTLDLETALETRRAALEAYKTQSLAKWPLKLSRN